MLIKLVFRGKTFEHNEDIGQLRPMKRNKYAKIAPDLGWFSRRTKGSVLEYETFGATPKAGAKTSKVVYLFPSDGLKCVPIGNL